MAKPRVFISSTFYDLQQIRVDLDKFIEGLGYEAIRNEEGDIPYNKDFSPAECCYKEISNIDILISILGGRFGSLGTQEEQDRAYSVSQLEVKKAMEEDKQIFIFIDNDVLAEYETYKLNKTQKNIKYKHVDDVNIYTFIEEMYKLKRNSIKGFKTAEDITRFLKEQFAGLFKQSILDAKQAKETRTIKDIETTAASLKELVDYFKETSQIKDKNVDLIIRATHPIVHRLKEILKISYNIYIDGLSDLEELLKANDYKRISNIDSSYRWEKINYQLFASVEKICINTNLFKDEKLEFIQFAKWRDNFIEYSIIQCENDEIGHGRLQGSLNRNPAYYNWLYDLDEAHPRNTPKNTPKKQATKAVKKTDKKSGAPPKNKK